MELTKMPKQYQLLHALSKSLFLDAEFKCAVVISKTPYLTALIACHGAKIELLPPYLPGTCLLLPEEDGSNKYFHAVIDETVYFGNEKFYWYKHRKVRSNSICDPGRAAKPCSYVEQKGKIYSHKTAQEWLGKHDISSDDLKNISNSAFPALIGHDARAKIAYWKNIPLGIKADPSLTMGKNLNIFSKNISELNTYAPKSFDKKRYENQIWINEIPEKIDQGRFLIILSPTHSNFEDLTSQVNEIYADNRLISVDINDAPSHLKELGIDNRGLLVTSIMRESNL